MASADAHAALLDQLGVVLNSAGYSGDGISAALGAEAGVPLTGPRAAAIYGRRLVPSEPLSALIELFSFGRSVETAEAERALAPLDLDELQVAGIVRRHDGDLVSSPIELQTHDGLVVAGDRSQEAHIREDFVAGPTQAAITLGHLTLRQRNGVTLDLGTGSGLQALLASRHSEMVVATDVNARALWLAGVNARLNGITNLALREGSWYEPVEGERFNMIVSNPPYVLSPESALIYRDSGLEGDSFCEWLVREAPARLADGGTAQILVNWVHEPLEDPFAPLRRWVEGIGCDALLLHYATQNPLTYAMAWNGWAERDPATLGDALDRWLDYYERLGISAIAGGAVILRRRVAPTNWTAAISVPSAPTGQASEHLGRLIAARERFGEPPADAALLDARLAFVQGFTLERRKTLSADGYLEDPAVLRLEPGMGLDARVSPETISLILACDGRRTLGELLAEISAGTARPEALRNAALAAARELVALGYLEAAG